MNRIHAIARLRSRPAISLHERITRMVQERKDCLALEHPVGIAVFCETGLERSEPGRDWVLLTDRQLIHWVHYLETPPIVKFFDLVAVTFILQRITAVLFFRF